MAKPIEPTPVLKGDDAKRLLLSLERHATRDEIDRRRVAARTFLGLVTKPKRFGR